ncbi:hypothetical protein [Streptomyces sp. NPDC001787]|uniref:hypothetical protein n=1 Tax=Streptomyces sp. NPDC001787 TaxID=3154523 RepID=UPI00331F9821
MKESAGHERSYVLPDYELMIVFGLVADPYDFNTGGYAPGFVEDWWTPVSPRDGSPRLPTATG